MEKIIENPPYIITCSPSINESQSIVLTIKGLKEILKNANEDDRLRIRWYSGYRASEFSIISK